MSRPLVSPALEAEFKRRFDLDACFHTTQEPALGGCMAPLVKFHLTPGKQRWPWEGSDLCWSCWREAFKAWTPSVVSPLASSFAFFSRLGLH